MRRMIHFCTPRVVALSVRLLLLGLCACSTQPTIVPLDTDAPQDITPLSALAQGKHKIVIVFLHGVGDHCPGYAFEGTGAWTRGAAFRQLGIHGARGEYQTLRTPISVDRDSGRAHVGTETANATPIGDLVTTEASLGVLGDSGIAVYGVEITWSELTWRLKTKNLDYDFTAKGQRQYARGLKEPDMACFEKVPFPEDAAQKLAATPPPPRAYVNRVVKEQLFDRSLSDAMLYAGPFKDALQRAVAKGVCDAVTMTSTQAQPTNYNASQCWVNAETALVESERDTLYLFVTHSLGSRMIYDVLRNLAGINRYHDNPFSPESDSSAFGAMDQLVCKIGAVYMMANQLPLLGLSAGGTTWDAIADDPVTMSRDVAANALEDRPEHPAPAHLRCSPKPLFVGFMDTNDLLSWGIRPGMDHSSFDFLTAYVTNTRWRWLGLYEDGGVAHSGYFANTTVGRLIACGSEHGHLRSCSAATP